MFRADETGRSIGMELTAWDIVASEMFGTMLMMTVGVMVGAALSLPRTKAFGGDWINMAIGWGFAVYVGVYGAWKTGGHLNPAVTIARALESLLVPDVTLNGVPIGEGGVPVTVGNVALYIVGQCVGAFLGSVVGYLALRRHFDEDVPSDVKLHVFCTGPSIRSAGWNMVTELIGTAVLVSWILVSGGTPTSVGPLATACVITVLVMALGGVSGAAFNPARDILPRLVYVVLPMKGKGDADWSYAWVPVVGPLLGAVAAVAVVCGLGLAA